MLYFRLFCKEISKPCGQFLRVCTKNTIVWEILRNLWKFLMKIQWKNWIFLYFLGKFVAKNRNLGNNITFLQQFYPVRGGVKPLTPRCVRHWPVLHTYIRVITYEWQWKQNNLFNVVFLHGDFRFDTHCKKTHLPLWTDYFLIYFWVFIR